VARQCASRLKERPGVVGLALYGSLAGDPAELTGFSDVDMGVILKEPMPAHFTEHRLVGGVKADLLLFHLDTLREIGRRTLVQLAKSSWTEDLFINGLIRGGRDTVLFDPGGEIARVKRGLAVWAPGREVERRRAAGDLREADGVLAKAEAALRANQWSNAYHLSLQPLWMVPGAVLEQAGTKRLPAAAGRLGIPGFAPATAALLRNVTMGGASVGDAWEADRELWSFLLRAVWGPVEERLRREGVRQTDLLEIAGDYGVFWHGNRVHELGRVKAEAALTLRWSRHYLDEGRPYEALEMLSWFMNANAQKERCRGLAAALKALGHEVAPIVNRVLRGAEFRRLAARAREADRAAWRREISPTRAKRFVEGVRRLHRLAAAAAVRG